MGLVPNSIVLFRRVGTLSGFPYDFRFFGSYVLVFLHQYARQSTFTCSKSTIDTLDQGIKQIQR